MARGQLSYLADDTERDGHPEWCARDHQCTALDLSAGEHSSVPEVWETGVGRLTAIRRRRRQGSGGWLELNLSVKLPDAEHVARSLMRHLIMSAYYLVFKAINRDR